MTLLIIIACSIVHSIFGVGLLVFGTPIFILLGHSYAESLWIVLPPSIAINALQIYEERRLISNPKGVVLWFAIPTALFATLALTQLSDMNIRKVIGIMLVVSAALRFSSKIQARLKRFTSKNEHAFIALIGSIHGLTNMGGGLLTSMMGTLHPSKAAFRVNVAFGYLVMALIKIATVIALGIQLTNPNQLPLNMLAAVLTYFVIGNALYKRFNALSFQHTITALILSFGVLLLV